MQLARNGLAGSGIAVAAIRARSVDPGPGAYAGVTVRLDGDAPQDRTPPCRRDADPLCAGDPAFNYYSVEVVQRIGYDSFTPDSGVLIAKNKDKQDGSCGYSCHAWVIDAKPADMKMVDFVRPDGAPVRRTIADYRQLNDALFHAGLRSGSEYEWIDDANRLHFYVIDLQRDTNGLLTYTIGVRSLDGAGPQARGITASAPTSLGVTGTSATLAVRLSNTGSVASAMPALHPGATPALFTSDVYRASVAVDGAGWTADLQNALVAIRNGGSATVLVHVTRTAASAPSGRVTVTVVSESDPTKQATATTRLR